MSVLSRRWLLSLTALIAGLTLLTLLTLLLAGCGQKGPLTLPQPPASSAAASASGR